MILAVEWAKENELVTKDVIWYKERWERGTMLENDKAKLVWDFQFNLRKTTTSRRPDLILENKEQKKIWICDMACPQQQNIETKVQEKFTKYRQLAFEMRERRIGYEIFVVPLIIGALGGGVREIIRNAKKIFDNKERVRKIVGEMQKTVLMDSESIIRKLLSGLVQSE